MNYQIGDGYSVILMSVRPSSPYRDRFEDDGSTSASTRIEEGERRRIIPTSVKLEVWKRDGGKCVSCGATDELHFDHIIPFSRGGTSMTSRNVQLLCARHNLEKKDKIQ